MTSQSNLKKSENSYDWLGSGIYFWENNPERALNYVKELKSAGRNNIEEPYVVGAVIDLGYCLNLLESKSLRLLNENYSRLAVLYAEAGLALPSNHTVKGCEDLLLRHLDCQVIETMHQFREECHEQPFDSVRGVFWEGQELYPGAGFKEKNHIQMCVRNPNCIKGFFRVRKDNSKFHIP